MLNYVIVNILASVIFFKHLFLKQSFDCVILQDPGRGALLSLIIKIFFLKYILKINIISEFHGDALNIHKNYKNRGVFSDEIISVLYYFLSKKVTIFSDKLRILSESGKRYLPPNVRSNIFIIPPYIDKNFFDQQSILSIKKEKIVIFVGSLISLKNGMLLINQFSRSNLVKNGYRLEFYGDGPLKSYWEDYARHMSKEQHCQIIFKGHVPHNQMINILSSASILVLPSKTEGFGRVLVEAMLSKVLCIGSNVEGIPELIKNKKTGYVFDLDNKDGLLEIFNFLSENGIDSNMIDSAFKYAQSEFNPNNYIKKMINMINS